MSQYDISLFGKFQARYDDQALQGLEGSKVQELASYLLLNKGRSYDRAAISGLLWGDNIIGQSREHLHEALWQIQRAISKIHDLSVQSDDNSISPLLSISPEWIGLNSEIDLWLDVEEFEHAFELLKNVEAPEIADDIAQTLHKAVALYKGDLLEGCYAHWCLYERQRLQDMYIVMLDRLIGHCESTREYELGLVYGAILLRYDPANEGTHASIMRLYYLTGDYTSAIRQYKRCAAVLMDELGIRPSSYTINLYERICNEIPKAQGIPEGQGGPFEDDRNTLSGLPGELKQLQTILVDFQRQILKSLHAIEHIFSGRS